MINVSDIVEKNGKTLKENNLEKVHNIPIDTLVEVKLDEWVGNGACMKIHARLYVVNHGRDCDGTPLYTLSKDKLKTLNSMCEFVGNAYKIGNTFTGIPEESLKIVEITDDIKSGKDSLSWEEEK